MEACELQLLLVWVKHLWKGLHNHTTTSLHVTQAFPILVLQATNAGVRRTGYNAMPRQFLYLQHCSLNKVHIVDVAIG